MYQISSLMAAAESTVVACVAGGISCASAFMMAAPPPLARSRIPPATQASTVAEFSSFANLEEKKRKSNLLMSFPKTGSQMVSFGQIRKN